MSCQGVEHDDRFGTSVLVLLFLALLLFCFGLVRLNDELVVREQERAVSPEESVAWRHLNSEAARH